jgi:dynein heavy chain
MAGLSNIMKMYEISLSLFLVVFKRALVSAKKGANLETRLKNMVASMTREMYDYTCTGIFERHKLMFSFQMAIMIMEGDRELSRPELEFFLKGDLSLEPPSLECPTGLASWLSVKGWKDLLRLGGVTTNPRFADVLASVQAAPGEWKAWYDLECPEAAPLPEGFSDALTPFQHLMLYRCLRPDRVYNGVRRFVTFRLGEAFVQPPVLDYHRTWVQVKV